MSKSKIDNLKKIIIDIFKMIEYYKTEGKPEKIEYDIDNFDIKKNAKKIYNAIDFYENYILNYNLYLYDILSQEVFLKILKTKKNNAIDIILENILNKIKKKYCNKEIIIRIEYIISNFYKINSSDKLKELIDILKNDDIDDLQNLYFIIRTLEIIKNNTYTCDDLNNIIKFINKFDTKHKIKLKKEVKESIVDKNNIDFLKKKYKLTISNIKKYNYLDKLIKYLDNL
jgi:hypothetical protein